MLKDNVSKYVLTGGMMLTGLVAGIGFAAHAQTAQPVQSTSSPAVQAVSASASTSVDTPESPSDPADNDANETRHHAPLGGDGVVSSVNGSMIVVSEEADEGEASYTVDASKASFVGKNGTALTLADIKVGSKVFVEGTVNGTNVAATSIFLGHPHEGHDQETNDDNGRE